MKNRIHSPKLLQDQALPTKFLRKELLSKNLTRIIDSFTISTDLISPQKTFLYIKRITRVNHLTIRLNIPVSQFKHYFIKKSSYFHRITRIKACSITLEVLDTVGAAYNSLEKYFKNCKKFEVHQYDLNHLQSSSLERYGHPSHLEKIIINSLFLKAKLQADSLRAIPIFKDVPHLDVSLNMSYENLPSTDSSILRNTIGKLEKLKILDLTNVGTSQIQVSAHLSDIVAMLSQLSDLEILFLRVNLWDFETNIIMKLVKAIQGLVKLTKLDLRVNITNKQYSNRSAQIEKVSLPNLKVLNATANNIPEERLVLSTLNNCRSLKRLSLSISVSNRDHYRALLHSLRENKELESLAVRFQYNATIPGVEELAEAIQGLKVLKKIVIDLSGKAFPLDQGLKKLVDVIKEFEVLEEFRFEAAKEFMISSRGLERVFEGIGEIKTLKVLVFTAKLMEKVEVKEALRIAIMKLEGLEKCHIDIMGMKMSDDIYEMKYNITEEHRTLKDLVILSSKTFV